MATQFGEDYGLVHEAIVTGRKCGAGKDFWARLAHNEDLFAKVVEMVMSIICFVARLTVNYGKKLGEAIAEAGFDYTNPNITEENFPPHEDEQGEVEKEFALFHFEREIGSEEAEAEMDKQDYRPASAREAIAFAKKHPDLQRKFPIIALRSVGVDRDGDRSVVGLGGGPESRCLGLGWYGSGWDAHDRFLAVRKCQKRNLDS